MISMDESNDNGYNNHIQSAFEDRKAFIAFINIGDPDYDTSKRIVKAAVDNGADLIELGIPFSDSIADGPVIQRSNMRALKDGFSTKKIFDFVKELRKEVKVPLVFMTYSNIIFSYGAEKFFDNCSKVGIDGVCIPDLPFEEKNEFETVSDKYQVDLISFIAPTSKQRIAMIAKQAKGFIYIVSSLGVTGVRKKIDTDLESIVKEVKKNTNVSCAIGFGISTPNQANEMAKIADGVIVGSAIVSIIEKHGKNAPSYVGDYVRTMKEAL